MKEENKKEENSRMLEIEKVEKFEKAGKSENSSKWNAITHGILKVGVSEYDEIDVSALYKNLRDDLEPKNILEDICIEMIVNNYIKLYRVSKAEKEKMKAILDPRPT